MQGLCLGEYVIHSYHPAFQRGAEVRQRGVEARRQSLNSPQHVMMNTGALFLLEDRQYNHCSSGRAAPPFDAWGVSIFCTRHGSSLKHRAVVVTRGGHTVPSIQEHLSGAPLYLQRRWAMSRLSKGWEYLIVTSTFSEV
jgi:hypothetical protein